MYYGRYTGCPSATSTFSDPPLPASGHAIHSAGVLGPAVRCFPPSTTPGRWPTNTTGSTRTAIVHSSSTRAPTASMTTDANGVDDVGERETSPPYPVPLRGIQVRLRIIDRDTRQVRQMTVSSDFIPE